MFTLTQKKVAKITQSLASRDSRLAQQNIWSVGVTPSTWNFGPNWLIRSRIRYGFSMALQAYYVTVVRCRCARSLCDN